MFKRDSIVTLKNLQINILMVALICQAVKIRIFKIPKPEKGIGRI